MIEKESVVPRYLQVKAILKDGILNQTLTHKLLPERELARRHGTSYMTVRRAVTELVDEGFLYREQGNGTFVCSPGRIAVKTFNLAFVIPTVVRGQIANPYFAHIFSGVQKRANEAHYSVLVSNRLDDLFPVCSQQRLRGPKRRVDGMIVVFPKNMPELLTTARFLPTVVADGHIESDPLPAVEVDNIAGAREAIAHMVNLGHHRIGHITGALDVSQGADRLAGYRQALADAGLAFDKNLVAEGDFEIDSGYAGAKRLLTGAVRPTAIFCGNDTMAAGAMRFIREHGLSIPRDISVMGFDDIFLAECLCPSLTTMRVPKEELGCLAVELVLSIIRGESTPQGPQRLPVTLVERESTAPPAEAAGGDYRTRATERRRGRQGE